MGTILTIIGAVLGAAVTAYFAGQDSVLVLGFPAVYWCAVIAMVIQWIAYVPAVIWKTEHFYDLVGALTYIVVVVFACLVGISEDGPSTRALILTGLVCFWALRLGVFLGVRVHKVGKDGRFDELKLNPLRFAMAWTVQGLWVFLTLLSVIVILTSKKMAAPLDALAYVGFGLWAVGLGIEWIADVQKSRFKADPSNDGRWIESGLWRYAQHPNYFGEILLWTGLFISGISAYSGGEWLAVLSPIFVFCLLTQGSGIPLLRERGDARWGHDPAYQAYRAQTNVLIPGPRNTP